MSLTDFQQQVARVVRDEPTATGFLLAGGSALIAVGLVDRTTTDLDYFAPPRVESVARVAEALESRFAERRWSTQRIHSAPTFVRLLVRDSPRELVLDLAIDAAPVAAVVETPLGVTFAPLELAGRKLLALFDRAAARDFSDVYALAKRFGTGELIGSAQELDRGCTPGRLAEMLRHHQRFVDEEIPAAPGVVADLRAFFDQWADSLERDVDGPRREVDSD